MVCQLAFVLHIISSIGEIARSEELQHMTTKNAGEMTLVSLNGLPEQTTDRVEADVEVTKNP